MVLQSPPSLRSILGEKYNIFLFQVHSLVQDANRGTLLQKEEGKNEERKKKRRAKTCFELFFAREKWRLLAEVSQTSGLRLRLHVSG